LKHQNYVGRFAPSPSGPLHYGSLVAATASYLQAKHHHGQWLVRIEDIDPPREVSGSAKDILHTLDLFHFEWDQAPLYQSTRVSAYHSALNTLIDKELVYGCACSRKELADNVQKSELGKYYPGICAHKQLDVHDTKFNRRLHVEDTALTFQDAAFGNLSSNLCKEIGDIIIYRKFDLPSYAIAVSVDDAFQNITEVVRGYDLLAFTPIQIYICQLLQLPVPDFLHIPIIVNPAGDKLSKQTGAAAVDTRNCVATLTRALNDLGQNVPLEFRSGEFEKDGLDQLWTWAIQNWDANKIPTTPQIVMS